MSKEAVAQVFGEIFSGSNGRLSSMRIMSMIGLIGGLVLLAVDYSIGSEKSYELVYVTLFGAALGGKAYQAKHEQKD